MVEVILEKKAENTLQLNVNVIGSLCLYFLCFRVEALVFGSCWFMPDSFAAPWSVASRLLCPWDSPGKNIGVSYFLLQGSSVQFSSVPQSCPTLCDPMNRSTPGFLSITNSRSSLRLTSIESMMPSSHLIFCRPLLLLPLIPPSIRVFSNESTLHMR